MKRGVPPTARNARTGELTPPGITRCARSNRAGCGRRFSGSGAGPACPWPRRVRMRARRQSQLHSRRRFTLLCRRQRPEEAVRQHTAHAGPKAGIEALVHEGEGFADRGVQLAPAASSAASAADSVSPAPTNAVSNISNFSPVSAPCDDASTLSMNCSVPLAGSMMPVTSTKRVPCSAAATASSRGDAGRSDSQSGSRKSVSVLWLPTSTSSAATSIRETTPGMRCGRRPRSSQVRHVDTRGMSGSPTTSQPLR